MKVVILAGGLGTRLKEETVQMPSDHKQPVFSVIWTILMGQEALNGEYGSVTEALIARGFEHERAVNFGWNQQKVGSVDFGGSAIKRSNSRNFTINSSGVKEVVTIAKKRLQCKGMLAARLSDSLSFRLRKVAKETAIVGAIEKVGVGHDLD